jgi:hypothetical protein
MVIMSRSSALFPTNIGLNSPDLKRELMNILNSLGLAKMPGKVKADIMRVIILRLCENKAVPFLIYRRNSTSVSW